MAVGIGFGSLGLWLKANLERSWGRSKWVSKLVIEVLMWLTRAISILNLLNPPDAPSRLICIEALRFMFFPKLW